MDVVAKETALRRVTDITPFSLCIFRKNGLIWLMFCVQSAFLLRFVNVFVNETTHNTCDSVLIKFAYCVINSCWHMGWTAGYRERLLFFLTSKIVRHSSFSLFLIKNIVTPWYNDSPCDGSQYCKVHQRYSESQRTTAVQLGSSLPRLIMLSCWNNCYLLMRMQIWLLDPKRCC